MNSNVLCIGGAGLWAMIAKKCGAENVTIGINEFF